MFKSKIIQSIIFQLCPLCCLRSEKQVLRKQFEKAKEVFKPRVKKARLRRKDFTEEEEMLKTRRTRMRELLQGSFETHLALVNSSILTLNAARIYKAFESISESLPQSNSIFHIGSLKSDKLLSLACPFPPK